MTRKTYDALLRKTVNRVKERRSLILDATFSRRHHRDRLRKQLDRAGVAYCFVEVQAPDEILKKRLEGRGEETKEISDARLEDFEKLNQGYEAPLELEARHLVTVGTDRPLERTVTDTLAFIAEKIVKKFVNNAG